jgi:hypothetical protein
MAGYEKIKKMTEPRPVMQRGYVGCVFSGMWTLQIPHGIHQESMGEGKVLSYSVPQPQQTPTQQPSPPLRLPQANKGQRFYISYFSFFY